MLIKTKKNFDKRANFDVLTKFRYEYKGAMPHPKRQHCNH
jgi:hypothetical protein